MKQDMLSFLGHCWCGGRCYVVDNERTVMCGGDEGLCLLNVGSTGHLALDTPFLHSMSSTLGPWASRHHTATPVSYLCGGNRARMEKN
jgi:hypothetical protein